MVMVSVKEYIIERGPRYWFGVRGDKRRRHAAYISSANRRKSNQALPGTTGR